jgi:hypothetical protein
MGKAMPSHELEMGTKMSPESAGIDLEPDEFPDAA